MTFAADIAKFAQKTNQSLDRVIRGFCAQLSTEIIQRTPVDTGRLRGSWIPSINSPSTAEGTPDKSGAGVIGKVDSVAAGAVGNVFYLVNNLPYAPVAEYGLWGTGPNATAKTGGTGYSIQAPQGMVRVSVQLATKLLNDAVKDVK